MGKTTFSLIQLAVAGCACLCAVTLSRASPTRYGPRHLCLLLWRPRHNHAVAGRWVWPAVAGAVPLVAALVLNRPAALGTAVLISLVSWAGLVERVERLAPFDHASRQLLDCCGLGYLGISPFVVKWSASLLRNVELSSSSPAASKAKLQQDALYDNLTGSCSNRQSRCKTLGKCALTMPTKTSRRWPLFIDLDNFKDVNDSHGHSLGDELLKLVALQLNQTITHPGITVARPWRH